MRDARALLFTVCLLAACSDPEVPATVTASAGATGQTATVGSTVATKPAVVVKSEKGTPLPGIPVTFAVASGGGQVTGATATTGQDGVATVGDWKLGNLVGENSLTATVTSLPVVTFTATGTPGAAATAEKSGDNQSAVVGAALATAPGVTIKDQFGNRVAGATVAFTVTGGGGTLTGASPVTNAQGEAKVGGWTLGTTAGVNTMSASTAGVAAVTFTATATASGANQMAKSAGDGQSATVARAVATRPSVLVGDQFGNPVGNVTVTFAVVSGGGTVTAATTTSNAQGIATVGSWTLGQTVGTNALRASAGALSVVFTATGTADAAAIVTAVSGGGQADTIQATLGQPLVAKVTDQFGNTAVGATVTFAVTVGGGAVNPLTAVSNAQGQVQATHVLGPSAGANTVRASVATTGATAATFTATAQWPPLLATELVVGTTHACAKRTTGAIVCWGSNASGELGNGSSTASGAPVVVTGSATTGYDRLTAGQAYTCAIRTSTGQVFCWGNGSVGQLGTGSTANALVPAQVSGSTIYLAVNASAQTTCALRTDGAAFCWGLGLTGQLGNGASATSAAPVAVSGGLFFSAIRAGQSHVCAITTTNDGYCWGGNTAGTLGSGVAGDSNVPVIVAGSLKWASLGLGTTHSCGTTTANVLYCWGSGTAGQLSVASPTTPVLAPLAATTTQLFGSLTAAGSSNCGQLLAGGGAWCWGGNADGQLNIAATTTPHLPSQVRDAGTVTFGRIALAPQFACAIGSDNAVYCWGNNAAGQLGDGTTTNSATPIRVRGR